MDGLALAEEVGDWVLAVGLGPGELAAGELVLAWLADDVGLGEEEAGLADAVLLAEVRVLVALGLGLLVGLGLADAGATARVKWIADTVPAPPAAPALAEEAVAVGCCAQAGVAEVLPLAREVGISMPATLNATTKIPAKALAAGAPAVRILTRPAPLTWDQPWRRRAGVGRDRSFGSLRAASRTSPLPP